MLDRRTLLALAAALAASCGSAPKAAPPAGPPLRLLTYNIRHGHGTDGAVDIERVARVVRESGANVVLLQEVDETCRRSGHVDQAAALGGLCGMEHRFAAHRPYDGGRYGLAALSRLPIVSFAPVELPPAKLELSALELVVEVQGREVVLLDVHLVQTEEERLEQARFILDRYEDEARPVVVAGDLNSERTSSVLAALYTQFDAPEARGDVRTFPADAPEKEIDFVLLAPRGAWEVLEHRVLREPEASDHRPVLVAARPRR